MQKQNLRGMYETFTWCQSVVDSFNGEADLRAKWNMLTNEGKLRVLDTFALQPSDNEEEDFISLCNKVESYQ